MDYYISKFSEYLLNERNYSDFTDTNYIKDLDQYNDYLKNKRINYKNISYNDIVKYIKFLKDECDYKSTSINRHLSSIRSFYNYLIREEIVSNNPFSNVKSQKKEMKLPSYMKYNELEEMINSCDDSILGIRNRCLLEMLFATGCRVSELVSIKVNDIDMVNNEIKVRGKGNKERFVYFTDYTKNALKTYLNESRNILLGNNKSEYLFVNHIGTQLTTRGVRVILDKIILNSSISTKVTPHTFRHTFATIMLNEGCDLKSVQELLGHANLSTTSIYTHLSNDRLKDVYLHTHPRSKK